MKTFLTIIITAILAAGVTWIARDRASKPAAVSEQQPLFYQSPMHPWIKSDKPGRCTICGMELVPIYPGEKGFSADDGEDGFVALSDEQVRVMNVQTAEAKVRPLVRTLHVAGSIDEDATRRSVVSAYIDGRVDKLYVDFVGAEMKRGEPLADFYSPNLLQAEREYRQLSGDMKRNAALRLRQMGLSEGQIAALPEKPAESLDSQILSPASGTVVAREVYEGQYVTTGMKLFELMDFSTMWFQFIVYEQDLSAIRVGQSVTVTTPAVPGKTFTGKVSLIDPNLDPLTRAAQVRVELSNPIVNGRRELLRNFYAEGDVEMEAPEILTIPRSAIIETGPQAVVYTSEGSGAYRQVPVEIGRRGDALVEITRGLEAGDRVVTNGNLLIDGQAELNRSFATPTEKPAPMDGTLSADTKVAIQQFLKTADAMAAALAGDDLAAFNKVSELAMKDTEDMTEALAKMAVPKAQLGELQASSHFHGVDSLPLARAEMLRFTMAATSVLEPLRTLEGFPDMQIWQCPMVNEAVPGADKKGRWIQTGDRPIGNPFFGSKMLECGDQIKP